MPPKRTIMVRTSERSTYKLCRQKWAWEFIDQIKPKSVAPALRFGDLIHRALEWRYPPGVVRGPHPADIFVELYEEQLEEQEAFGFKDESDVWNDAKELGVDMMENFIHEYGKDEDWRVISSEQTFQVPILDKGNIRWVYVGTLDGVWENRSTKEIFIKDWKTAASISTGGHLTLDEQPSSYWAYGPDYLREKGLIKPKQRIAGIHFTYLRKAKVDLRPRNELGQCLNQDGTVSKKQPAAYFKNEPTYRDEYEQDMLRHRVLAEVQEMEMVRQGELEVIKNPGQFTCGMGCGFKDMCELHETGADWEFLRDSTMEHWDPYAAHEIYFAERR